jgi:RND family efflux transporter MFP subunit
MRSNIMVALALGGAALCACQRIEVSARTPTAVRVRSVERAAAAAAARYSATIEPASRVDVAFRVGGYIESIAKVKGVDGKLRILQEGDRVTKGMELASVRKADYLQRLGEAKAALGEAVAAAEQAQLDFDRSSKLAASQSVSKAELDNARVRLDAARARVDGARVRVDEAMTAVGDSTLKSPMDGVIMKRAIEVGALAAPGSVACSIADNDSMKAVFGVPDTVLETLRLGASQSITSEAKHGVEFSGRITRIAPVADAKSRVFEVEVTVPNSSYELKAGMIASLKLATAGGGSEPIAVLPLTAVVHAPGKAGYAVYVLDDKAAPPVARVRPVQLGEFLGNLIPIKDGLSEGEKVIVMGATLVSDGEAVQVIP